MYKNKKFLYGLLVEFLHGIRMSFVLYNPDGLLLLVIILLFAIFETFSTFWNFYSPLQWTMFNKILVKFLQKFTAIFLKISVKSAVEMFPTHSCSNADRCQTNSPTVV